MTKINLNEDDVLQDLARLPKPLVLVSRKTGDLTENERSTIAVSFPEPLSALPWLRKATEHSRNLYAVRNRVKEGQLFRKNKNGDRVLSLPNCDGIMHGNPPLISDIQEIWSLPLDFDPAKHFSVSDLSAQGTCRAHACQALEQLGQAGIPVQYVMDSGRGIQAGLRFAYPKHAGSESFRDALFFADRVDNFLRNWLKPNIVALDNISNVNRFSRLAGTVNQKTGRLSKILEETRGLIVDPAVLLRDVHPTRTRYFEDTSGVIFHHRHIDNVISEIGKTPNAGEAELINDLIISAKGEPSVHHQLDENFAHWAETGQDFLGRISANKSDRQYAFAHAAIHAGEPIGAVYQALMNVEYLILNEHVLCKQKDKSREAIRNCVKAIMSIGIEIGEGGADYEQ